MFKKLRQIFFLGVFASAPLALTIYVLISLFRWFDDLFQPVLRPMLANYVDRPIPGLGIVLGILFILVVGVVAPSLIGKQFIILTEKLVDRLPFAKLIYSATKQLFDSFSTNSLSKFNRVVMVQFPKEGTYTLGFVTQDNLKIIPGSSSKLAIFVPTTPNPTGGYLIFVNEKETIPVDMTVEDALKFIISGGLVRAPLLEKVS